MNSILFLYYMGGKYIHIMSSSPQESPNSAYEIMVHVKVPLTTLFIYRGNTQIFAHISELPSDKWTLLANNCIAGRRCFVAVSSECHGVISSIVIHKEIVSFMTRDGQITLEANLPTYLCEDAFRKAAQNTL